MFKFLKRKFDWTRGISEPSEEVAFDLSLEGLKVGTLRFAGGRWIFEYAEEFKKQSEIAPIMDFPGVNRSYIAEELWPFFALRIPSPAQPKVRQYLQAKRKPTVDTVELLQHFGRRSSANPFLLEAVAH
ncbi:MAG: HipA N-terminal domain-containing protein [Verrucomicrobiae bacterium]|nr:HipA N-terminal domain-containing protein [Verrucomicrobiae bacterium]MCP5545008.1 HipA N-terminal domain-containing protein [Akkermansiaceae bacterium]